MTFYAVEIEVCPAYGWEGGPTADVRIKTLKNRQERRNKNGNLILHSYTLPFQNVPDDTYLEYIKSAFMAMGGPGDSFLAKDEADFRHGFASTNYAPMRFGVGDGNTADFQLYKRYSFGGVAFFDRLINKPLADGFTVYVDGIETAVDLDTLTGIVSFATADVPNDGALLTWEGEFRVCVRFSDFHLPTTIDSRAGADRYATNGSCSLIEVPGE